MINNKVILITGGTGSFGNELVKYLLKFYKPKKIIIFSRDEYKQDVMRANFSNTQNKIIRYLLGDVRDLERLKMAMRGVDIVVHAAALKQVPAAEYNPMEFVKTNVHGAENIVLASIQQNVKKSLLYQLIKPLILLTYMVLLNLHQIKYLLQQIKLQDPIKINFQL